MLLFDDRFIVFYLAHAKKLFSLLEMLLCETKRTVIRRAGVKKVVSRTGQRKMRSGFEFPRNRDTTEVTFEERLNNEVPRT